MNELQSQLSEIVRILQNIDPSPASVRAVRDKVFMAKALAHANGLSELEEHLGTFERYLWQETAQLTVFGTRYSNLNQLRHFFSIYGNRLASILKINMSKSDQKKSPGPLRKRVLVVEDSEITQLLLKKFLSNSPDLEVVGVVAQGDQILSAIEATCPDVITLDIFLADRDGFEILEEIKKKYPIPVVIVSSITGSNGIKVFHALYHGAVDFIHKSSLASREIDPDLFCERIYKAAKCSLLSLMRFYLDSESTPAEVKCDKEKVIVIGASLGGTRSLIDLLTQFPKEIPPILVFQKIAPAFSKQLIQLLHETCSFIVKEAEDGETVAPDKVLVMPPGKGAILSSEEPPRIKLIDGRLVTQPLDALFESAAAHFSKRCVAVLTGGFGIDGATGISEIRRSGGVTVVEDEYSAYDPTLPREAVRLEGATVTCPSDQIPELVITATTSESKMIEFSIDSIFSVSSPRILIADDSPTIRAVMRHCLRRIGLTDFVEARNGIEAWKLLVESFEKRLPIDLVISDQNMPQMKGTELLDKVRNHSEFKTLPFILATAEAEAHQVIEAAKKGVTGYVTKPVSLVPLLEKIKAALSKSAE